MSERRIEVVYCDDIRPEMGNKNSLMGVYSAALFVDAMPATLPKLCAWVNIVTPPDRPFSHLRIKVMQEDITVIDTGEIITEGSALPPGAPPPEEDSLLILSMGIAMSPFQIDAETSLRIVAETDDGDLKSRRLKIRKGPAQ